MNLPVVRTAEKIKMLCRKPFILRASQTPLFLVCTSANQRPQQDHALKIGVYEATRIPYIVFPRIFWSLFKLWHNTLEYYATLSALYSSDSKFKGFFACYFSCYFVFRCLPCNFDFMLTLEYTSPQIVSFTVLYRWYSHWKARNFRLRFNACAARNDTWANERYLNCFVCVHPRPT